MADTVTPEVETVPTEPTMTREPTPSTLPAPSKKPWTIVIILGVILLALLGLVIYVYLQPEKAPRSASDNSEVTETTPSQATSGEKEYFEHGISFKYPENFVVIGDISDNYSPDEIMISVQVDGTENALPSGNLSVTDRNTSGLNEVIDDIYNTPIGQTWSSPTMEAKYLRTADIQVGGETAHHYTTAGQTMADAPADNQLILVQHQGKYYVIQYTYLQSPQLQPGDLEYGVNFPQVFEDIIQSFSFTE